MVSPSCSPVHAIRVRARSTRPQRSLPFFGCEAESTIPPCHAGSSGEDLVHAIYTGGLLDYYSPMAEDGKRHNCRAELVDGMKEKRMRCTVIDDVGKLVASALELEEWPDQLMMSGENLTCKEFIGICEKTRNLNPWKDFCQNGGDSIHMALLSHSFEYIQ
ncbi:hypothetical protein AJ78_04010 [Emergomyces pasteurianus Ep9510]|uniref:Uncharacterized protein n=1 Tax=Emergomyces pasteurianus Ep9510 TaxID=1447872 RepID=A0A1J9PH49_9EURO|nr:hypothetical protein AJ78_04010 [Emergomyces pasteurianus Ep9510]